MHNASHDSAGRAGDSSPPRTAAAPQSKGGRAITLIVLLVWTFGWTALVGSFDYVAAGRLARQLGTYGYVATTGEVTEARVESRRSSRKYTHRLVIAYRYQVGGQAFEGNVWSHTALESSDRWAQRVAHTYRPGTPIAVYYSPSQPTEAVIEPGLTGTEPLVLLFITPFNLVVYASWRVLLGLFRHDDWRGVRGVWVTDDGQRLRVRLPQWSPGISAGFTAFGGCLLAALLVALAGGSHPPLWLSSGGVVLVLAATAEVMRRIGRPIWRGDSDLVFDRFANTLQLPATQGRASPIEIPLANVNDVEYETVVRSTRKNGVDYNHFTTLTCRDPNGASAILRLMRWDTAEQADAFAHWLRQQLTPSTRASLAEV